MEAVPDCCGGDPDNECARQDVASCGQTGVCDGARACAVYPASATCLDAHCPVMAPGGESLRWLWYLWAWSHRRLVHRIHAAAVVVLTVVTTRRTVLRVIAVKRTMMSVPLSALKGRPALERINVTAVIV